MPRLYNWFLSNMKDTAIAHGIVTGHNRLPDAMNIHTSKIKDFIIKDNSSGIIVTMNTEYEVERSEYNKERNNSYLNELKDRENLQDWQKNLIEFLNIPEEPIQDVNYNLEENSILLSIGNNREYYFDKMIVNDASGIHELNRVYPHIGMFQDSVLCTMEVNKVYYDLRYFTFKDSNIEIYCCETNGLDLHIHNCGDNRMLVKIRELVYLIEPGETKLIAKENAGSNLELTNKRDLYSV